MSTILIAEDRAVNRQYLAMLLTYCGHRVLEAADGREALTLARRERPDLVISDILMPVMDGCELARQLRADPAFAATPIIFYTATYLVRDARALAEECGVQHILIKPCEPQVMLDTVKAVLGLAEHPIAPESEPGPLQPRATGLDKLSLDLQATGMRLSSVIEIALDLGAERDPAVLVERFCRAAQDIVGTTFAAVGLLARDGSALEYFFTSLAENGSSRPLIGASAAEFTQQMPALLAGRPSSRISRATGKGSTANRIAGFEHLLAVEIRCAGRANGWLLLADKPNAAEFTLFDEQIALSLSAQLAVFYQNARLCAEAEAHTAQLEREIARREQAEEIEAQHRAGQARAEAQLRKLSSAVEHSPAAIVITDTAGCIEYVNPKFESISGYTAAEVCRKSAGILGYGQISAEESRRLWQAIRAGGEWRGEIQNKRKNGELFWEFVSVSPIRDAGGAITHFVAVKEDITEKKRLAAQFLRAQRLDCIGALASGVAHDLNNILAPILMSAPLLRGPLDPERFEEIVGNIEICAQRGADVVKQVLAFARGSAGVRRPLPVPHLLREMEKVAAETFPKNIRIETSTGAGLSEILCDATQLHQVLLNLCVNARDAMPEGGTLRLRAENLEIDSSYASMLRDGRPGSFVALEVSDTGTGIPPELHDRIFEAFFTTKPEGQGTGLGLATVRTIVQEHGGFLSLQSQPGQGTTFRIFLPAALDAAREEFSGEPPAAPRGGGEVILVVDDEASIRVVAQAVLESQGYEVLVAADGVDAVAVYAQNFARIAAVVTDVVMPFMDGVGLTAALRRINPAVKVIATSGFAETARLAAIQALKLPAFLAKPYSAATLLTTLSRVLCGDDDEAGCEEVEFTPVLVEA